MGKHLRQTAAVRVAEELEQDLPSFQDAYLPPLTVLCRKYGVSRPTMIRAAHFLRSRGLISFGPGTRIAVAGRSVEIPAKRVCAANRLADQMRDEIIAGVYQSGQVLPKWDYLAALKRVSSHTVHRAYAQLVQDKMVHRDGREYVVGPKPPARQSSATSRPVILIAIPHSTYWNSIRHNERIGEFGSAFVEQARQRGVQLAEAVIGTMKVHFDSLAIQGRQKTRDYINQLGTRYAGTLACMRTSEVPNLEELLVWFAAFGKPVVWFDNIDEGTRKPHPNRNVFRCRCSEELVVQTALDYLCKYGHRNIAFHYRNPHSWVTRRFSVLCDLASRHPEKPIVTGYAAHDKARWTSPELLHLDITQAAKYGNPVIRNALSYFVRTREELLAQTAGTTPKALITGSRYDALISFSHAYLFEGFAATNPETLHMADIVWQAFHLVPLLTSTATALIAPNDATARGYLRWLRVVGIAVPEQLSVISFDNDSRYSTFPLTSVNFGFSSLGYLAFHALLQDITVKQDRLGTITAVPSVADNGSVGFAE